MTLSMQALLGALSTEESRAVYNALAQWADNERNGLAEEDEPGANRVQAVTLVEGVVARLETVLAAAAG